ncbi:uncharacterized protein LOC108096146 [Drosophila ficusphila]|uniref:uncharacterized protein LOC108096146 n=1 Tax=Drosophila ficusphila TaxID=30025 RepID=UPI001C8A1D7E|nr:uncharacterized protein LOC108096146 [Drosophila ficusphila]
MQSNERQQVIARNVPQLVRLLLDSPLEGREKHEESGQNVDSAIVEICLNYAKKHLEDPDLEECCPESVMLSMGHFLDRYRWEQLPKYGETFKQLANVILTHPLCVNHEQKDLQYRLLDFMLCVNYKAFKEVHNNRDEMEQKRKNIMEALTLATESSEVIAEEIRRRVSKSGISNSATSPRETPRKKESDSYCSHGTSNLNRTQIKEEFATKDAKLDLELNITQVESTAAKPTKTNYFKGTNDMFSRIVSPWWQVDIHVYQPPRIFTSSFSQGYGDWLVYQLRKSLSSVRKISEEHQLMRELVICFFATVDQRHFQILDNDLQVRKDGTYTCAFNQLYEGPFLAKILEYVKQMRHLRQFIEDQTSKRITGDRLETLTSFSVALRRLLRPVIEYLVYFESRLTKGIEKPTLEHFLEASSAPLERLNTLFELAKQISEGEPSMRSLRLLDSLFKAITNSNYSKFQRSLNASLLLHSLLSYCQFIDSWWSTGEFTDWHDEFPYQRLLIERRTEYALRKIHNKENELLNGKLFQIIQQHMDQSREAVATLYDARRIGDFNLLHGNAARLSLHNELLKAVIEELTPYQTERIEETSYAPDILEQLKKVNNDPVRRLLYSFHMETRPDPRQLVSCSVDELVRNFQACAPYTPISDIICQELRRLLHRRSLLVNSYMTDLENELQMPKKVNHLRSVFLLLNYDLFRSEFELFFELLERNQLMEASYVLSDILVSQDPRLGYLFKVYIIEPHPEFIYLLVSYDPFLNRVIRQEQIEQMNICFRLMLNLHYSRYQLEKISSLDKVNQNGLITAFRSLQQSLVCTFEKKILIFSTNLWKVFNTYEVGVQGFPNLNELIQNHELFLLHMNRMLQSEFKGDGYGCSLDEVLKLSRVLRYRWLRAMTVMNAYRRQKPTNIFELKYEWLRFHYLQSTFEYCKAIGCFLRRK